MLKLDLNERKIAWINSRDGCKIKFMKNFINHVYMKKTMRAMKLFLGVCLAASAYAVEGPIDTAKVGESVAYKGKMIFINSCVVGFDQKGNLVRPVTVLCADEKLPFVAQNYETYTRLINDLASEDSIKFKNATATLFQGYMGLKNDDHITSGLVHLLNCRKDQAKRKLIEKDEKEGKYRFAKNADTFVENVYFIGTVTDKFWNKLSFFLREIKPFPQITDLKRHGSEFGEGITQNLTTLIMGRLPSTAAKEFSSNCYEKLKKSIMKQCEGAESNFLNGIINAYGSFINMNMIAFSSEEVLNKINLFKLYLQRQLPSSMEKRFLGFCDRFGKAASEEKAGTIQNDIDEFYKAIIEDEKSSIQNKEGSSVSLSIEGNAENSAIPAFYLIRSLSETGRLKAVIYSDATEQLSRNLTPYVGLIDDDAKQDFFGYINFLRYSFD